VVFTEDDHVIEKLATNRSYEAFRRPILPRTLERCSLRMDPESRDRAGNLSGEDRVVVEDEAAVRRVIGESLSQLLDHPPSRGMASQFEVEDTLSSMIDHEPDVEQRESHGGDDEEVHSRDRPGDSRERSSTADADFDQR